jgi:hypothetical protein
VTAPRGGGSSRVPGAASGARGAVVVGLAVILGIVGLQILDDSGPSTSVATVTTTAAPSTGGGSPTTAAIRPANEVKVKVYNASGVQGRAQILTDQLRTAGYNMQAPANLSGQRTGTTVACIDGFKREGTLLALYGVGNGAKATAYPSDPPAGASEADCLVFIGNG